MDAFYLRLCKIEMIELLVWNFYWLSWQIWNRNCSVFYELISLSIHISFRRIATNYIVQVAMCVSVCRMHKIHSIIMFVIIIIKLHVLWIVKKKSCYFHTGARNMCCILYVCVQCTGELYKLLCKKFSLSDTTKPNTTTITQRIYKPKNVC